MTSLADDFAKAKIRKRDMLKDSFTVMFADTRHGMDEKTKAAFNRVKERAEGDTHVAKYVAKIELSISNHMPHAVTHAAYKM
jgi:hypothetical protein